MGASVVRYRKGTLADLDGIVALVGRAVRAMQRAGIDQWDDRYPTAVDFRQDIVDGALEVGTIAGRIAVVYAVNRECDDQYANGEWSADAGDFRVIHRLCVDPDLQDRGIASEAILRLERILRQEGVGSLRLDVFSGNPSALRLYERNGYRRVGTARWRKGTFHLMEKRLGDGPGPGG